MCMKRTFENLYKLAVEIQKEVYKIRVENFVTKTAYSVLKQSSDRKKLYFI